jgi:hypothetical protein
MEDKPKTRKPPTWERTLPTWKKEPYWNRLHICKVALVMAGFITDAESRRIQERMLKAIEREQRKAQPNHEA